MQKYKTKTHRFLKDLEEQIYNQNQSVSISSQEVAFIRRNFYTNSTEIWQLTIP